MKRLASIVSLVAIFVMVLSLFGAAPAQAGDKARVFVQFAPGQKAAVEKALTAVGAEFHYKFDELNAFAVSVPEAALAGLRRNPNVVLIEEDALRAPIGIMPSPNALELPDQVVPYGIDMVQARDVWDADRDGTVDAGAPTGSTRKICIIDSGFYTSHEDLGSANVTGYAGNLTWNQDGSGHGTHVAGTIRALNNTLGVVGVTPGTVQVYVVRVFGDDGLWAYSSTLVDAANRCASAGANIISMSLGGSRSVRTELTAFANLYNQGILSIAAAGNEGTSANNYPASYTSVVSVAAIDSNKVVADFSQYNSQVELAAPGVSVLSTVPYLDDTSLTVGGIAYPAGHIEYSARGSASGALVDGGLCTTTNSAWSGKVVLCQRGDISFYDKVMNVQNSGGAAAAIYNNVPGGFLGTLGEGYSSSIIGISLSQEDGLYLVANKLGQTATVASTYTAPASGYEYYDGTSMATPHVSAVAALVWSYDTSLTNAEIRSVLGATALDLGAAGRDVYYGYGLVQAADALLALGWTGGGGGGNTAPTVSISSPANNASFDSGATISFAGSASDLESGDLSGSLAWTSNLDGPIGTGSSFSAVLSDGTHSITASVTDAGGLIGSASITITVGGSTGQTVTVSDLANASYLINKNFWKAAFVVTINPALSGAVVSGTWGNGSAASCTTDGAGQCTVSVNVSTKTTSITFTVNNVVLSGYEYVPGVTSITVTKP